jgi:hypothetical protein
VESYPATVEWQTFQLKSGMNLNFEAMHTSPMRTCFIPDMSVSLLSAQRIRGDGIPYGHRLVFVLEELIGYMILR